MSTCNPESVVIFKKMYAERKSIVEYMIEFGSTYDKALATVIKEVATEVPC